MPFRYILKRGGVEHTVGYSLAMLALGMLVSMMVAVVISIQASERAVRESERRQCESLAADIQAYVVQPPRTPAGIEQLRAKRALYQTWGCPVPSEKER
jgi:hypothetical protein